MDLVGRDDFLRDVRDRVGMQGRRLVSLVGPGGIGKTTLARTVHAQLSGPAAIGLSVELAPVEDPDAVPGAIAAQLDFPSFDLAVGSAELAGKVVLIDNCEHVLDSAAAAIETLLTTCPTLVILATSRTPLALPGESIVALTPLELPEPGSADSASGSLRLLRERAQDNGVTIADSELELAADVCRRLDGMPLALELAAARLRTMSLAELATRLGEGVGLLSRQRHRGPVRHRSVRDTIDWSIRLLDSADRVGFARLGVCPGAFDLDLAAALADRPAPATLELVERLVEASLLDVERQHPLGGYRMLEPIRAVAMDELRTADLLADGRERFVDHVHRGAVAMLEEASRCWSAEFVPSLMARFDQIAAGLRLCLEFDEVPTRSQTLAILLSGGAHQGRVDDTRMLAEAVARRWEGVASPLGPHVAAVVALGKLLDGDLDGAEQLASTAIASTGEAGVDRSWLERVLAFAARFRGDRALAAELFEKAACSAARAGAVTYALDYRASAAQDLAALGRTDDALDALERIAAEAAEHGSVLNEAIARTVQAEILANIGDPDALRVAEDALSVCDASGFPFGVGGNLQTIARCRLGAGDVAGAAAAALDLVDGFARAGAGEIRCALDMAAAVLYAAGHTAAADLEAAAQRLPETHPMSAQPEAPGLTGGARPDRARLPGAPLASGGARLDRSSATELARSALTSLLYLSESAPPQADPSDRPGAAFCRAGDLWELSFAGSTVHVAHTKGLDDLAVLLTRPGQDIHCAELAGAAVEQAETGEVIDATARRQYEARIRDLQAAIDEAEENNDYARAERAQTELDTIVEHLAAALGLSGKARRTGGTTERARSAVTHRIRAAVRRIADAHPPAGRHLDRSITTGTYCRYDPERPIDWIVRPR